MDLDPLPHKPVIVDLDEDIRENTLDRPVCDFCTKPENISKHEWDKVVAFDTYAELKRHRRIAHERVERVSAGEPSPIEVQISTLQTDADSDEIDMKFAAASVTDIRFWHMDMKKYMNTDPRKRDMVMIATQVTNLRSVQ